jgi:maltose alpha-D-glucosyltransferase/alpha-amylase
VSQPQWYKDAIFYEVRVRSFADQNGDGIGDFAGLTERLDYLRDLGVTALWLLPFYPSPLKDDGYDISDYVNVHPECGTLRDFKTFVREAHARGLRVVTELILNHTSDQHPWFQRARRARRGSAWRDFYVWSDTPDRYAEARIIFKDFETSNWTWDPVAGQHYWHRFYSSQPDLNFDNPAVRRAMFQVIDFWLRLGVDGVRLDAVPYLFEREGTNCENLPETHAFLKELRRHVDAHFHDRMLLAEANQWPEDAVAYFGNGDECHMAFHFPIMPRLFMALHMEDRFPIVDIVQQTPAIPESAQWALFLRNHDELTLEMVTDEERDYMYRVYAFDPQARINLGIRRRLAPLLANNRRRIELMNGLLFSLPGTPILYYGDEIGMGDNVYLGDRNGVRTPMQWSADRNAGFSRANPQRLYLPVTIDPEYHYETVNVEAQQNNSQSLLWWMKRLIALRQQHPAFGRGTLEFQHPRNGKVLAFIRRHGDEHILVVANLSRYAQFVELNLAAYKGQVAVELFGGSEFPPIGDLPYLLTLGPHSFYWFALRAPRPSVVADARSGGALPVLQTSGAWETALTGPAARALTAALPAYFQTRRWFGGKALRIKGTEILDAVPFPTAVGPVYLTIVGVEYAEGPSEQYLVPIAYATGDRQAELERHSPHAAIARIRATDGKRQTDGLLYDGLAERPVAAALLAAIRDRRRIKGPRGTVLAAPTRVLRDLLAPDAPPPEPSVVSFEQSNTAVLYDDRVFLKLFRRPQPGVNPDFEIGRHLTELGFPSIAPVAGVLEYHPARGGARERTTLAILNAYVPNEGDAWRYTLDEVERYFERAVIRQRETGRPPTPVSRSVVELTDTTPPRDVQHLMGGFLESARLLGRRVAELHAALAAGRDDPAFAPEPFTKLYQRSLYQSMRNLASRSFRLLDEGLANLPPAAADLGSQVLASQARVLRVLRGIMEHRITALRIRCHGDLHLGQVLFTGKDFIITDFEGEPARPLSERRIKRSPLRDVAGMLRSFDYAVQTILATRVSGALVKPEDLPLLDPWARCWRAWVSSAFLKAYLKTLAPAPELLPPSRDDLSLMLQVYVLEKAVYELAYELNNRPDWVAIPMAAILELIGPDGAAPAPLPAAAVPAATAQGAAPVAPPASPAAALPPERS